MLGITRLSNRVQEYAWGSNTAIAELLGNPTPSPKPQAELWMGAHPKSPSEAIIDGKAVSLIDIIRQDPQGVLGQKTTERFSGELPFLFKLLAAASPLSIQAHPNIEQAREGYERENREKIPIDAYHRSYRDRNHKPEIITALTPFWAMSGFRPAPQMLKLLGAIGFRSIRTEIKALEKSPVGSGLKSFFHFLLTLPSRRKDNAINEALSWARKNLKKPEGPFKAVCSWMIRISGQYPGDIGILSPALLNLICLKPGEAMFTEAGVLHAYLDGVGVELMANSDNVLRGGLTGKYIDVPELLKVLSYTPKAFAPVPVIDRPRGETEYDSPACEFRLSRITLSGSDEYVSVGERSVEIVLCTEGSCTISESGSNKKLAVNKGQSIFIPASVPRYTALGSATLFKAAVPL